MSSHVVIVGGGFGGLTATQALRRAEVNITLVDRRNHHLFQPLLYQVATGGLSPANIAKPLRSVLAKQENAQVLLAEVVGVDPHAQKVQLADGSISYDWLILATGARHCYFGNDNFEQRAPGLKSIEDATEIRRRVLEAFETAERGADPDSVPGWLTFVIVGGGPTGVELAGAVAELARDTMRREFRTIDPTSTRVVLVEAIDRILPSYEPRLSAKAVRSLEKLGVEVRTNTTMQEIRGETVCLKTSSGVEKIPCRNVIWAAGVEASPVNQQIANQVTAETDRSGRLVVEADCSLAGHDNIFVIGDAANFSENGKPLPGIAPVAIQQAKFVSREIVRRIAGEKTSDEFRYRDQGQMATIGRAAAVAQIGKLRFGGYPAWLAWLFVHLLLLVGFENRLLVFVQWWWNYWTRNRGARLITHSDAILVETDETSDSSLKQGTGHG